mmetsp:Transcript_48403/g.96869  ORF Transcript_48403/g.96869 Transcript_48403/m.96869 type:complete len:93 (+) Transcript_48403:854-1132(+)
MNSFVNETNTIYIPRKCSYTNRILTSKEHSSIQINIGTIKNEEIYEGNFEIFSLCGKLRKQGRADEAINFLVEQTDFLNRTLVKKTIKKLKG